MTEDEAILMQVGHALNMVSELPEWIENGSLEKHIRHAALDGLLVNARLLTDFFLDRGGADTIKASDFFDPGRPARTPARWRGRLGNLLATINKHCAHLDRIERTATPLRRLTRSEMRGLREAVWDAASEFVDDLIATGQETRATVIQSHLTTARSRAAWPIPPWDGD